MKLGQLIERLITKALMKDLIQKRGLVISSRYFDKNEKTPELSIRRYVFKHL